MLPCLFCSSDLPAQKLGLESIPARIASTVTQRDEILAYIQAKHPDKGYNLDEVLCGLVMHNRRPESVSEEIAATVAAILEFSGKQIRTRFNVISLLKLVPKIQDVIAGGKLSVSQIYLFAANLGSPDLFTILVWYL